MTLPHNPGIRLRGSGVLLCVVGPSGSGKSSLGQELLREEGERLVLSVSATSRPPREGEHNGVHYHFLSRAEFEAKRESGFFFESEEVHGNYYGTPRQVLEPTLRGERDLLLDVDIKGALNFRSSFPKNAVVIFIAPPSQEEMVRRITSRAAISQDEVQRRLTTALMEYQMFHAAPGGAIDYLIVNYEFGSSLSLLRSILHAERARVGRYLHDDLRKLLTIRR